MRPPVDRLAQAQTGLAVAGLVIGIGTAVVSIAALLRRPPPPPSQPVG